MSDEQNVAREVNKLTIGLLAVLVLGIGIIVALNVKAPSQGGTAPSLEVPEASLVPVPPELVRALLSKGISEIALIRQADNQVEQVLTLRPDGTCEACQKKLPSSKLPNQVSATGSQGYRRFDLLESPTAAGGAACPHDCLACSGGHCKNTLGSCCKCT